jgi:hypothetical protein
LKLKLALIALLLIAALLVSGCCCCVIPSHKGYHRVPHVVREAGQSIENVRSVVVPAITAMHASVK